MRKNEHIIDHRPNDTYRPESSETSRTLFETLVWRVYFAKTDAFPHWPEPRFDAPNKFLKVSDKGKSPGVSQESQWK